MELGGIGIGIDPMSVLQYLPSRAFGAAGDNKNHWQLFHDKPGTNPDYSLKYNHISYPCSSSLIICEGESLIGADVFIITMVVSLFSITIPKYHTITDVDTVIIVGVVQARNNIRKQILTYTCMCTLY